jgi:hypothetical protein
VCVLKCTHVTFNMCVSKEHWILYGRHYCVDCCLLLLIVVDDGFFCVCGGCFCGDVMVMVMVVVVVVVMVVVVVVVVEVVVLCLVCSLNVQDGKPVQAVGRLFFVGTHCVFPFAPCALCVALQWNAPPFLIAQIFLPLPLVHWTFVFRFSFFFFVLFSLMLGVM